MAAVACALVACGAFTASEEPAGEVGGAGTDGGGVLVDAGSDPIAPEAGGPVDSGLVVPAADAGADEILRLMFDGNATECARLVGVNAAVEVGEGFCRICATSSQANFGANMALTLANGSYGASVLARAAPAREAPPLFGIEVRAPAAVALGPSQMLAGSFAKFESPRAALQGPSVLSLLATTGGFASPCFDIDELVLRQIR